MIKVRLLQDGGFNGMTAVTFPVEVMAYEMDVGVEVPVAELERIGADMEEFRHFRTYTWLPWEYEEYKE